MKKAIYHYSKPLIFPLVLLIDIFEALQHILLDDMLTLRAWHIQRFEQWMHLGNLKLYTLFMRLHIHCENLFVFLRPTSWTNHIDLSYRFSCFSMNCANRISVIYNVFRRFNHTRIEKAVSRIQWADDASFPAICGSSFLIGSNLFWILPSF